MTNINGLATPKWQDQKAGFSKWTTGLDDLSEDPLGLKVFESFLHTEGYLQYLEFLWACEGMKNIGHKKSSLVPQIVNCIYSHYILSGVLYNPTTGPILNTLRQSMGSNEMQHQISYNEMVDMLNDLKVQIDLYLRDEIYPKFLKSSMFSEAMEQHNQQEIQENYSHPSNLRRGTSEGVEIKDPIVTGHVPSFYRRKIIFVLNNDDLPTHQTLITTTRNHKQKTIDPENFVKELTEKLQLLKLDQEREEAILTRIDAAREAERTNQSIFCSKLTEALYDHIGKECANNAKSIKCNKFNSGDDGTVKKQLSQMKNQTNDKIDFSCQKRRIKISLQNFTIFKSTRKVRANIQKLKCGKYSVSCVKQKSGHGNRVSKYLTKSQSWSFSESDPEFCDAVLSENSHEKQSRRKGVSHSLSFPTSMDRIQNWINESNTEVVSHLDTVKLLN